jgi:predicted nucleotidyltransferase
MIASNIKNEILIRLKNVEIEHDVKILYAVESGSRAWGFESPNSDYDVRFIYVHPKEWYLDINIENKRDVIEYEIIDEIDINGWDIRKALKLFWKSNPAFVEWLKSPIVYIEDGKFATKARGLLNSVYLIEKGIYHYRSMAQNNFRGYLKGDQVRLKKYFYVLRPLFAIKWLVQYREPAPVEFHKLRLVVNDNAALDTEISELLKMKKASKEMDVGPANKIVNNFIEKELNRLGEYADKPIGRNISFDAINELFKANLR